MHFLLLLAVAPLTLTLAGDSAQTRHARLARRALAASKRADKVHCATYNYTTPVSLAEGSLDSAHGCGKTYKVVSGDTCASILSNSNSSLSLEQLHTLNPAISSDCWNLEIGTSYCVGTSPCLAPRARSLDDGCVSYARAGTNETYRDLAAAHNVTLADLRQHNVNATEIRVGRFYCISNGTEPVTSSSSEKIHPTTYKAKVAATQDSNEGDDEDDDTTTTKVHPKTTTWTPEATTTWTPEATTTWAPDTTTEEWKDTTTEEWKDTTTEEWQDTTTTQEWQEPTTKEWQETTTSEEWQPETTTKAEAAATQAASSSSDVTMTGDFTYFDVGLGSCGWTNSNDELVAAAPAPLYDLLGDSICGKYVTLNYGGNSVTVKIVDKCPPCSIGSYDLSPTAFQKLAPLSVGRASMSWDASSLGSDMVSKLASAGY